ncbi:hypothetical protein BD309DRAFT_960609 [Dichomitus squalens]|nr:hypothetical protein BD309DRAFT_960609 [Dichomitus squalens]
MPAYEPASPVPSPPHQPNVLLPVPVGPLVGPLAMPSRPAADPPAIFMEWVVLVIIALCLGTIAVVICRQLCAAFARRRRDADRRSARYCVKTAPRILILPTLNEKGQSWSTLKVPTARLRTAASSRVRDSVLCKSIGGLGQSDAGKLVQDADMNDYTYSDNVGAYASLPSSPDTDPDLTLRPRLPPFRGQSKHEWNGCRSEIRLATASSVSSVISSPAIPAIVVEPCTDVFRGMPESLTSTSMYSQESWCSSMFASPTDSERSTPGPPPYTPGLGTLTLDIATTKLDTADASSQGLPAGDDFPRMPGSFEASYLCAPAPSWNAPHQLGERGHRRAEHRSSSRNVSSTSRETFVLPRPHPRKKPVHESTLSQALASDARLLTGAAPELALATQRQSTYTSTVTGVGPGISTRPYASAADQDVEGARLLALEPQRKSTAHRDSTLRFSALLDAYRCSVSANTLYASPASLAPPGNRNTLDPRLRTILDQYRGRAPCDDRSSIHRALDGWVNAGTCREGPRSPVADSYCSRGLAYDRSEDHEPGYCAV